MTKKRRKRRIIRLWYHHPLFLFVLALVTFVLIRSVYHSFTKKRSAIEQEQRFNQEYQELLEKREQLQEEIEFLQSDRGKEEEYRKRFDVVREGEQSIRIIN